MTSPIQVDEAYLLNVVSTNVRLAGEIPASPNGVIEDLPIKAGHQNFRTGQDLANAIRAQGTAVKKFLVELGTTASLRASQLRQFIDMTDGAEDFNTMTALEFLRSLPGWGTGGTTGSTPTP